MEKWAGYSKTVITAIAQLLVVATVLGVQLSQDDISGTTAALTGISSGVLTLVNIYGRFSAKHDLFIFK